MAFQIKLYQGDPVVHTFTLLLEDASQLTNWVGNGVDITELATRTGAHRGSITGGMPAAGAYGSGQTWQTSANIMQAGFKNMTTYTGQAAPGDIVSSKLEDLESGQYYYIQKSGEKRFVNFYNAGSSNCYVTVYDDDGFTVLFTQQISNFTNNGMQGHAIPPSIPKDMTLAQFVAASKEISLMPYSYGADDLVATWTAGCANDRGWTAWLYYILHNENEDVEPDIPDNDPYGGDDSPYLPSGGGGGDGDNVDPYDDGDNVPVPPLPEVGMSTSGMMSIYTPSDVQLNLLASYLWDNNFVTSMVKEMYANCMDVIISLGIVPFNITAAGTKNIKVGDRDSGISSNYPSGEYFEIDCGSLNIQSVIGSYMDYEPYTKLKLYLPYIGWVDLNNDIFMKKSLGVVYHVNIATGECVAFVTSNSNVIGVYSGNCLMKIPLSGANYGEMWGSVIKATVGLASCGLTHAAATGLASQAGNYASMAGSATGRAAEKLASKAEKYAGKAESAFNKAGAQASGAMNSLVTKPTFQISNQLGMTSGFMGMQSPVLMVQRPNLCIPAGQNTYQGYPSFMTTSLSGLRGYTRLADINLSVPSATGVELGEIMEALLTGVYIEDSPSPSGSSGNIYLYRNKSSNNTIGKTLESVATLSGTFRDAVDVNSITVRIHRSSPDFNYIYVPDFGRCYYVNNITIVRTGVLDVQASVDPLNSFKGEILANRGIINKQAYHYNLYLNDDSLKVYQNPLISLHNFSAGFSGYEYVLLVAGG